MQQAAEMLRRCWTPRFARTKCGLRWMPGRGGCVGQPVRVEVGSAVALNAWSRKDVGLSLQVQATWKRPAGGWYVRTEGRVRDGSR